MEPNLYFRWIFCTEACCNVFIGMQTMNGTWLCSEVKRRRLVQMPRQYAQL